MKIIDYTGKLNKLFIPYKATYPMTPKAIVWHETDNTAPAVSEIKYMQASGLLEVNGKVVVIDEDRAYTSFHWAVDEENCYLGIPMDRNTWQSGDGVNGFGNRECISIEICKNICSDLTDYYKARENCIELTAMLCYKYNILPSQDTITEHCDYQSKNCPRLINNSGDYPSLVNAVKRRFNMIEELMKKIASMEKAISRMQLEIDALNENTAEKYNKIEDCPQWSKNTIKLLQNKPRTTRRWLFFYVIIFLIHLPFLTKYPPRISFRKLVLWQIA